MSIGDGESSAGKAIGIIFVIYFIISLILLVATSNNDKNLCLIVFGQLFVVFGFVALLSSIKNIKNKKYRIAQRISTFLMSLLFVLIGASVGGVGFLKKTGNYDSFIMYRSNLHPSNYNIKLSINNYHKPSKKDLERMAKIVQRNEVYISKMTPIGKLLWLWTKIPDIDNNAYFKTLIAQEITFLRTRKGEY